MSVGTIVSTQVESLGAGTPEGLYLGNTATSKIGAYGTAPVSQIAIGAFDSTTTPSESSFGFTSTQAASILAAVAALKTIGIVG